MSTRIYRRVIGGAVLSLVPLVYLTVNFRSSRFGIPYWNSLGGSDWAYFYWLAEAAQFRDRPFGTTTYLAYPQGTPFLTHFVDITNFIMLGAAEVFGSVVSPRLALFLYVFLLWMSTGAGTYLLARTVGVNYALSIAAGVIIQILPAYRTNLLKWPQYGFAFPVLYLMYVLIRGVSTRRQWVSVGIAFVICCLTDYYWVIFGSLVIAAVAWFHVWSRRRSLIVRSSLVAGSVLALCAAWFGSQLAFDWFSSRRDGTIGPTSQFWSVWDPVFDLGLRDVWRSSHFMMPALFVCGIIGLAVAARSSLPVRRALVVALALLASTHWANGFTAFGQPLPTPAWFLNNVLPRFRMPVRGAVYWQILMVIGSLLLVQLIGLRFTLRKRVGFSAVAVVILVFGSVNIPELMRSVNDVVPEFDASYLAGAIVKADGGRVVLDINVGVSGLPSLSAGRHPTQTRPGQERPRNWIYQVQFGTETFAQYLSAMGVTHVASRGTTFATGPGIRGYLPTGYVDFRSSPFLEIESESLRQLGVHVFRVPTTTRAPSVACTSCEGLYFDTDGPAEVGENGRVHPLEFPISIRSYAATASAPSSIQLSILLIHERPEIDPPALFVRPTQSPTSSTQRLAIASREGKSRFNVNVGESITVGCASLCDNAAAVSIAIMILDS